jgi:serine/threonine protein kinase
MPKTSDFGLSTRFTGRQVLTEVCGTSLYHAPNSLSYKYKGPKVDMWTLGIALYFMVMGIFLLKAETFCRSGSSSYFLP